MAYSVFLCYQPTGDQRLHYRNPLGAVDRVGVEAEGWRVQSFIALRTEYWIINVLQVLQSGVCLRHLRCR